MSPDQPHPPRHETMEALELLRRAERMLMAEPNAVGAERTAEIRSTLARVEAATPGGAPLHAQLDNVRKWLAALERPSDHDRFGGAAHVHGYVLTQIRLAQGALEEYSRAME